MNVKYKHRDIKDIKPGDMVYCANINKGIVSCKVIFTQFSEEYRCLIKKGRLSNPKAYGVIVEHPNPYISKMNDGHFNVPWDCASFIPFTDDNYLKLKKKYEL